MNAGVQLRFERFVSRFGSVQADAVVVRRQKLLQRIDFRGEDNAVAAVHLNVFDGRCVTDTEILVLRVEVAMDCRRCWDGCQQLGTLIVIKSRNGQR